jgi:hypothetical protein
LDQSPIAICPSDLYFKLNWIHGHLTLLFQQRKEEKNETDNYKNSSHLLHSYVMFSWAGSG